MNSQFLGRSFVLYAPQHTHRLNTIGMVGVANFGPHNASFWVERPLARQVTLVPFRHDSEATNRQANRNNGPTPFFCWSCCSHDTHRYYKVRRHLFLFCERRGNRVSGVPLHMVGSYMSYQPTFPPTGGRSSLPNSDDLYGNSCKSRFQCQLVTSQK